MMANHVIKLMNIALATQLVVAMSVTKLSNEGNGLMSNVTKVIDVNNTLTSVTLSSNNTEATPTGLDPLDPLTYFRPESSNSNATKISIVNVSLVKESQKPNSNVTTAVFTNTTPNSLTPDLNTIEANHITTDLNPLDSLIYFRPKSHLNVTEMIISNVTLPPKVSGSNVTEAIHTTIDPLDPMIYFSPVVYSNVTKESTTLANEDLISNVTQKNPTNITANSMSINVISTSNETSEKNERDIPQMTYSIFDEICHALFWGCVAGCIVVLLTILVWFESTYFMAQ